MNQPVSINDQHIAIIHALFREAEQRGILIWLESGWAIDARLGYPTRDHEDIDIAFAAEHELAYRAMLAALGFDRHETMDYGFLSWRGNVLLDSEPCFGHNGEYGFDGFPSGSCPLEPEGTINGHMVRCLSWQAMYGEFLGYLQEVPQSKWRPKDLISFAQIEAQLDDATRQMLQQLFTPGLT